jgi:hypothetical protein
MRLKFIINPIIKKYLKMIKIIIMKMKLKPKAGHL